MKTLHKPKMLIAAIFTMSLVFGGTAHSVETVYPSYINWSLVERWTYEYEYESYENSEVVEWLQFWLKIEPKDSIYGPETNHAHRQRAMELNIPVAIYEYDVPFQDFGPAVERWREEATTAIAQYGGPPTDINKFLRVMRCESMGNPDAYNLSSGASGLMQHLKIYWDARARVAGFEGASPFDPIANIHTSAWLLYQATGGGWQHWVCQ